MTSHQEKTLRSNDGITLFYRDFGSSGAPATPILCLPGIARNSRDFIALAERLSPSRRVLCPDFRGRGFSGWDSRPENYSPPIYAADIVRLLEIESIGSAIIVGTSLGGLLSMLIAATNPTVTAGVVLNDIGPEIAPAGIARALQYVGSLAPVKTWAEAIAQAKQVDGGVLRGLTEDQWAAYARRGYRERDERLCLDYDPRIDEVALENGPVPQGLWELFAALKPIPTLVLRGALSDFLCESTVEKMAAMKPDLRRAVIPDRGHPPLLDEPESLAAIESFIAQIP